LVTPARLETIEREREGFRATLRTDQGAIAIHAQIVIDAGGRNSPAGRRLGCKRKTDLPLLCMGVFGRVLRSHAGAGITFIEAVRDGWWYTAPLPGQRRVLAFHTDADNGAAARACTLEGVLAELTQTAELARLISEAGFDPDRYFMCPASGSTLDPCAGNGWLATGDAALTFDPLSSQGLLNALFLGLAAAQAAHSELLGQTSAIADYVLTVKGIRSAYCRGLSDAYSRVHRWPDSSFWQRRSGL
jgi:flavin-dependent dehydrogenase